MFIIVVNELRVLSIFILDLDKWMPLMRWCMYFCSMLSVRCRIPSSISHVQSQLSKQSQHYSDVSAELSVMMRTKLCSVTRISVILSRQSGEETGLWLPLGNRNTLQDTEQGRKENKFEYWSIQRHRFNISHVFVFFRCDDNEQVKAIFIFYIGFKRWYKVAQHHFSLH